MCAEGDIARTEAITNEMELVKKEINNIREQLVFVKNTYEFMHKTVQELEENNSHSSNDSINYSYSHNNNNISNKIQFEEDDTASDYERSSDYNDELTFKDVYQGKPKEIGSKMSLLYDKRKQKDRKYQISQPGDLFIERNMAVIKPTPSTSSIELYSSSDDEYSLNYLRKKKRAHKFKDDIENTTHIPIGLGNTMVPKDVYDQINWNSYTAATRKLLMAVFSRKVLSTHSLTGKQSPAFLNKPAKQILNPRHVADIVYEVTEKCNVKPNLVRIAITTKCADENKMMRTKLNKPNAI